MCKGPKLFNFGAFLLPKRVRLGTYPCQTVWSKYSELFLGNLIVSGCSQTPTLANLLPASSMHDLRHSHASFMVNSGRTLYEVQHILGHTQVKTTQRYAHLSHETLLAATNSVNTALGGVFVPMVSASPAWQVKLVRNSSRSRFA